MAHFGILSFKGTGHLNPLIALSKELIARGHRVSFVQRPELENRVVPHGVGFCVIGKNEGEKCSRASKVVPEPPRGLAAICYRLQKISDEMEMYLRDAPEAMRRAHIDVLIVDEIVFTGPTLAEILQLPYFIISTSIPHHFGWRSSLFKLRQRPWDEIVQSALLETSVQRMHGPVLGALNKLRRSHGLGKIHGKKQLHPALAHITALPQCLDLPRRILDTTFHYTGPFVNETARVPVEFPWKRLDGRRLVYASLGTTLKGEPDTFRMIAEACASLDLQLVISLGGRRDPTIFHDLPGAPIVVQAAPQLELLKKANVVVTHAGPNTAFEALLQGVPMVAIPKAFDQPGIAERLRIAGVAEVLPHRDLRAEHIRTALIKVLDRSDYLVAAQTLQREISSIRGLELAADIIENALRSRGQNAGLRDSD